MSKPELRAELSTRPALRDFVAAICGVLTLAAGLLPSTPASAQNYGVYYRPRQLVREPVRPQARDFTPTRERLVRREPRQTKPVTAATSTTASVPKAAAGEMPSPLVAVIDLASQRIQVHGPNGVIAQSRISSGKAGNDTPTGIFSILQRNRHHESNIYSGAPMPYMQRLTWSGIALHEGNVPGYPASHGCIRLPAGFASEAWGMGRIGMRVIVAPSDTAMTAIQHNRLPTPVLTSVPVSELPDRVRTAAVTTAGNADGAHENRLLDPFRLAQARKIKAVAQRIEADAAVKSTIARATEASAEANRAGDALRAAERALDVIRDDLEERRIALARDQTAGDESEPGKAVSVAEAAVAAAEQALSASRVVEAEKSDAAFAAARAMRDAEAAADAAQTTQRLANAGVEPVTIFVSRKEGRVLVRQGFVPLHDEPIAIAEPDRPLGTHVFTAMESFDAGAALTWSVVSVPGNTPDLFRDVARPRRGAPIEPRSFLPPSHAAEALERIELPEATRKLVADKLWPGATVIVSDFGVSGETGKGTDFIVLTK